MRCVEHISHVVLNEFGEFFVAFVFMRRNDLHQTRALDAGFVRKHENEKHVFIDNGVVFIVVVEAGFMQNVIQNSIRAEKKRAEEAIHKIRLDNKLASVRLSC